MRQIVVIALSLCVAAPIHGMENIAELFNDEDCAEELPQFESSSQVSVDPFETELDGKESGSSIADVLHQLVQAQKRTAVAQEKTNQLLGDLARLRTIQVLTQLGTINAPDQCIALANNWNTAAHIRNDEYACKSTEQTCILDAVLLLKEKYLAPRLEVSCLQKNKKNKQSPKKSKQSPDKYGTF